MRRLIARVERLEAAFQSHQEHLPSMDAMETVRRIQELMAAGTLPARVMELIEMARQRRDTALCQTHGDRGRPRKARGT